MAEAEDNWWKRPWGIAWLIGAFLFSYGPAIVSAEGNVGCIFLQSLCMDGIEWCYDDYAFGKCLPNFETDNEELEREPLTEEQSRIMATMLEEMQGAGLGWDHPFVQCRIQGALFSLRQNTILPPNLCGNLAPDPEVLGPQSPLAFVRFKPPNEDFADEVYYPPSKKRFDDQIFVPPLSLPGDRFSKIVDPIRPFSSENMDILSEFSEPDRLDEEREHEIDEALSNQEYRTYLKQIQNRIKLQRMLNKYKSEHQHETDSLDNDVHRGSSLLDQLFFKGNAEYKDDYKRTGPVDFDPLEETALPLNDGNEIPVTSFRELANSHHLHVIPSKEHFNFYQNSQLEAFDPISRVHKSDNENENYHNLNTYPMKYPNLRDMLPESSGVYTEGGLVFVPEHNDEKEMDRKEKARNLLANMLGFTRHERLDVKKPGPLVGPPPSVHSNSPKTEKPSTQKEKVKENKAETKEVLPEHIKEDKNATKIKKVLRDHTDEEHGPHSVDTEYTHVILKNPLENWRDGERIVAALADILHMQDYLTHARVDRHEVSFRVEANPEKKTAADVARLINDSRFKNNIFRRLGVTVVRAGVGDKTKEDPTAVSAPIIEEAEEGPDVTHIMIYMFAGAGAAAVVVIFITLFLIKRHDKKRDKLGGLQAGLSGPESCSKDYQELCRARMAGKGTPAETISSGRITSLTKENDRPPSSRSSTSSWSEEPALTNMDISTGHMVLSYMEDHLRNKGRLQREWEALCRYEAEPSAREAAMLEPCTALNRVGAPLPYDHSRVVLNHLANAEGLDYINASTITDHDPRAPAYVAAQGPLPTTLAHFWQMIWEQGAVVIVALCRLQENGEIACARYWPEEGAEVYHIYEVHLVSEHIWCDDYLVRSFYLKNLRTSETRTVTQFHFLSWPQSGVPSSAKALLEFRRKVNKSYRGRSCPIVVHGSNGAGRTGAYILLDLVLGRMNKGAREIDIAATLEHLRDQRAGLVATRQQFEFVLMAVAEEVHAILKALPTNSQGEKRDLEKDSGKDDQGDGQKSQPTTASSTDGDQTTDKTDKK